jgi:signal transduction histidine kinase
MCYLLLAGCSHDGKPVDPLRRSRVDGLNKEAFVNRYRQPDSCLAFSQRALDYLHDSLPDYADGRLRALNNMAFAHYQKSNYDNARQLVDQVIQTSQPSSNLAIETVIANLLKARLLQRNCQLADSYRLLYDIGRSHILERNNDNLLYNYAQTEYYITLLTLNFHYRNGKEADVRSLLDEVERRRPALKVDYAQDMALNYALAYGWQSAGESLRALDYCDLNFDILDRSYGTPQFCLYNYANTLQMTASILKSLPGSVSPDSVLALYDEARRCFFDYGDPYQMLGGVTSTARFALLIGDTLRAHEVLDQWRDLRGTWRPFSAPKMELGYFDVIIRSCLADSPDENRRWYEHRCELQDYIARNEAEDFALQQSLDMATRRSRWLTVFSLALGGLALLLLVLLVIIVVGRNRLRREKRQLEDAKRRDVERIANVETCLSVMRHDISPFIGYLSRPDLPADLRAEVLGQLLRTFDNIKGWTSLSIPSGLVFNASTFPLQEVFDDVSRQVINPRQGVFLDFQPTEALLWADRLLITILLRNLVNNALQHTEQGSVSVAAVDAPNGMVHITVADTGSGMTAEQCDNLFKADKPGTDHGFGLILCRYIVKKHDDLTRRGCRIWVESQPHQGTTMHLLLPNSRPAHLSCTPCTPSHSYTPNS